jgi:hypothetical protein
MDENKNMIDSRETIIKKIFQEITDLTTEEVKLVLDHALFLKSVHKSEDP